MKALENKLLNIKNDLEDKLTAKTRVEGQLEPVTKSILEKSKCKSVDLARKYRDKIYDSLETKKQKFKQEVSELENEFYQLTDNEG